MKRFKLQVFSTTILFSLFLMTASAFAQNNSSTDSLSWDTNADNYVDADEFDSGLDDMEYYDTWDTDSDGIINESEWNDGVNNYFYSYDASDYGEYNAWDENGDGVVKEDEFDNGLFDLVDQDSNDKVDSNEYYTWYNDDYYSWDANADNYVDADEFDSGLDDMEYYGTWDTDSDGIINESEWNDGVDNYFSSYDSDAYGDFNAWDENGDGVVKEDEFDNGLFDLVDQDSNDKIEQEEYVSWFDDDNY